MIPLGLDVFASSDDVPPALETPATSAMEEM